MKKDFILFIFLFATFPLFSQVEFKPGFIINNKGDSVKCFIDYDWQNSPLLLKVKLNPESSIEKKSIDNIKEFGIDSSALFVRSSVLMDTSETNFSNLNKNRYPEWKKMQVFLKVLLIGKASLYVYQKGNFVRFLYSINQGEINQLVYKQYIGESKSEYGRNVVLTNNLFQQQLMKELSCNSSLEAMSIRYRQKDLINYFKKYNLCIGSGFVDKNKKSTRKIVNFKLLVGVNSASIDAKNTTSNTSFSFDRKSGYEVGFEAEAILPINRDKIRVVFSPTFQQFNSSTLYTQLYNYTATNTVDYKAIEIPFGVRYYMYLSNKTKLFITGLVVPSITFNSSAIECPYYTTINLNSFSNFSIGTGVSYQRFSAELRFNTSRNIANDYLYWNVSYNNISLKLGYVLFNY